MNPKRRVETIKLVYWACSNEKHRHQSKKTAQKCLDKEARSAKHAAKVNRWDDEKIDSVIARHEAGETFVSIGRSLGVTGGRIGRLVRDAKWSRRLKAEIEAREAEVERKAREEMETWKRENGRWPERIYFLPFQWAVFHQDGSKELFHPTQEAEVEIFVASGDKDTRIRLLRDAVEHAGQTRYGVTKFLRRATGLRYS